MRNTIIQKQCIGCNNTFPHFSDKIGKVYCSKNCKQKAVRDHRKTVYKNAGVSDKLTLGNKGSIAEMLVAADLTSKGYYVFTRAVPCTPFDLVAYKNGIAHLIEVKSVAWEHKPAIKQTEHTILAVYIFNTKTIKYFKNNTEEIQLT